MDPSTLDREQLFKFMLKASLCVAAPAVVPFVMLISTNAVSLLDLTGLGRMGMAGAGILIVFLANLFWKGHWWAGLPSLLACTGAAVLFTLKFFRPLFAYLKANPINDIGDITGPMFMLSPALVVIVISVSMGLVIFKGVRLIRGIEPRRVSGIVWGLCLLWAVVLVGDAVYQRGGWRYFNQPSDLIVRLCADQGSMRDEAKARLLEINQKAVPALLLAKGVKDPDLGCLRDEARDTLVKMGATAAPALVKAAKEGNLTALTTLQELKIKEAAGPLLKHLKDPKRKPDSKYEAALKETIKKLDPNLGI